MHESDDLSIVAETEDMNPQIAVPVAARRRLRFTYAFKEHGLTTKQAARHRPGMFSRGACNGELTSRGSHHVANDAQQLLDLEGFRQVTSDAELARAFGEIGRGAE